MSDTIIQVENLSKRYIIKHQKQERYTALRDVITNKSISFLKNIHNQKFKVQNSQKEDFWALKDISFEIKQGDRVGIIGRNGAGKSTLLKILSRITEPTSGRISIKGRVASLLEVGTGFHPELTGRENTYLNGAILGMSKAEITRKFDEIVDFAEVEKFLDTPVKHYSSGMYVRLAFAVAVHLEPEILIVDEVLAVGDAQFQKKCLGKMEEVGKEGRTILFVSHNLGILQSLCTHGILLGKGTILANDTANKVVESYIRSLEKASSQNLSERADRNGSGESRLIDMKFNGAESDLSDTLIVGSSAIFVFYATKIYPGLVCFFSIYNQHSQPVTLFDSSAYSREDMIISTKESKFICEIDELLLLPGRYRINAGLWSSEEGKVVDYVEYAASFQVEGKQIRNRPVLDSFGSVFIPHRWKTPT